MANLVLSFAELLAGAIILDAGVKGASVADVVQGKAQQQPLPGSSSAAGGTGDAAVTAGPGQYVNPIPGATASRVDQGVDYTLTPSGFRAPGKSQILTADSHNSGWKGGGYIAAKLLDGPLAGQVYYVAEGITPAAGIAVGSIVNAGQQLVVRATNPYNGILGNIEAGWANPSSPGQPLAQSTGGYSEGASTAAGASFNRFIQALGGPLGTLAHNVLGHLSAGLP